MRRYLAIYDELQTTRQLIEAGFGNLQEIDMGNTFYHLPHLLLASGFERLMKCYVLLVHAGRHGRYLDVKALGHNLDCLLDRIVRDYCGSDDAARRELCGVAADPILREAMKILTLFGNKGRYHNLDVVAGRQAPGPSDDPTEAWNELEKRIEDPRPYLQDKEALHRDYYPRVNRKLVASMEGLARAIALQFTMGGHHDPKRHLAQLSSLLSGFRSLMKLGETDYRRSVRILRRERHTWEKRTDDEIFASGWPTRVVTPTEYCGEWPFRHDRVVLELRDGLFCIAYIAGYAFALNGARTQQVQPPRRARRRLRRPWEVGRRFHPDGAGLRTLTGY